MKFLFGLMDRFIMAAFGLVLAIGLAGIVFGLAVVLTVPALAAPSDFSFAATTLGIADPTWEVILNAFFWLALGLVITWIVLEIFRRPGVRDRYTAAEYNEAVGLRRIFIADGGQSFGEAGPRPVMSMGEAIYIVGVIAVERVFAFGIIALIVWAAVS